MAAKGEGWPFIGRRKELAFIARAMGDAETGGLVLAGPVGVGKTRLALKSVAGADPSTYVTRRTAATEAARSIPFGALAPLLPPEMPALSRRKRVNPLRLASDALLAVAGERRLVLAVDDAQLLDDFSATLVHQLVRTSSAFALIVVRSGEPAPDPISALWRNRLVERIDLDELTLPDVEQVLVEHLGGPVDGRMLERLWRASAGNALVLRELVSAGRQAGAVRLVEGLWRWHGSWALPPRLVELIEHRLGRVDAAEREVLELLAYADGIGPDLLGRLTPPEALEAVEAKALCRVEQRGRRVHLHLAHPVDGEVLRARTPALRARRRRRQLAEVLLDAGARRPDDPLRLATWLLASGTDVAPELLVAGARQAWASLQLALAERLARAAFTAGAKLEAMEILWPMLVLQGRATEVEAPLVGLDDRPADGAGRTGLDLARAYHRYWGLDRVDDAIALLQEAAARAAEPRALAALQALQALLLVNAGEHTTAARLAEGLLDRPDLRRSALAQALLAMGMADLVQGRGARAIAGLDQLVDAGGLTREVPWLREVASFWRCQADLVDGRLATAAAAADAAYRRAVSSDWDFALGMACLCLGRVSRAHGQVERSSRWLREGLGVVQQERSSGFLLRPMLLAEHAHTLALHGDTVGAERALAEADHADRRGLAAYHLWTDPARIWVAASRGNRGEAIQQALAVAAAAGEAGSPVAEATALHDATRLGAAGKAADRLRQVADHTDSALVRCYAAHAAALTARDGDALDRVSLELEGMGALLLAAEAAAEAAPAHRGSGRGDHARRAAARAARLAAKCEGATTPALHALQAPALTRRQWQIVKLAAAGLTNEEIARRLVVSIRTVHNHLHHAYTKLGVHSRTELTVVVDARPSPHDVLGPSPGRPGAAAGSRQGEP